MDLQQLQAIGAVKDRTIVPRKIKTRHFPELPKEEWPNPDTPVLSTVPVEHEFDTFIRKRSSADSVEMYRGEDRFAAHIAVFRCVVDAKGQQVFPSLEDVIYLEEWMFLPLFAAVNEVNNLNPKHSPPTMSFGARSPSRSGAGRSANGRTRSSKRKS